VRHGTAGARAMRLPRGRLRRTRERPAHRDLNLDRRQRPSEPSCICRNAPCPNSLANETLSDEATGWRRQIVVLVVCHFRPTSGCVNDHSREPLGASRPFCSMAWPGHSEDFRVTSWETRRTPREIASTMHDAARSRGGVSAPGIRRLPFFECGAIQRNFVVSATYRGPD
jgi:hypothetical protein